MTTKSINIDMYCQISGKGLVLAAKNTGYILSTVLIAILLGSALAAPTLPVFADKGQDKPKKGDPPKNHDNNQLNNNDGGPGGLDDDHHKKIKKDPDHDHDKDKKACKHGDTNKKGKYRHNCDSDHDFFP